MNKKDLHKIIKEELDNIVNEKTDYSKRRSGVTPKGNDYFKRRKKTMEADTKVQDQGYASDYYGIKSDITETWETDQIITNDIKGFLKAAFDTSGGSTQGDTKQGGSNLVKMATDAILKGIQEYRKQEPKDYVRESTVKESMVKVFTYAKDYTGSDMADIKSKAQEVINKLKAAKLNVSSFEDALYIPHGYKDLGPSIAVLVGENIYICEIGSSKMIKVSEPMAASMVQRGSLEAYNIQESLKEEDNMDSTFLNKSDFDVEKLDASDLIEYDLVLDDLMAVIKKYKWIKNLDKSVIAKQVLHDKKLVGDAIKKQKERRAIRKDYNPKAGRI